MNTATRLGAYGAGLALLFGGAFLAADAVVPQSTVTNWTNEAKGHDMDSTTGGHHGHGSSASTQASAAVPGVTSAQGGYLLTGVVADGVARLASTSTATLFTGANVSATRHAKIRREKLSMTACR